MGCQPHNHSMKLDSWVTTVGYAERLPDCTVGNRGIDFSCFGRISLCLNGVAGCTQTRTFSNGVLRSLTSDLVDLLRCRRGIFLLLSNWSTALSLVLSAELVLLYPQPCRLEHV